MIRNKEQAALLDLMKKIVRFFDDNDLKYYLFAGSAIGGLRHGGFIPWDNDIDIIMDRENYYKMIGLADRLPWDDIEMISPENSEWYYRPYVQFSSKRDTGFLRSGMFNVGECMGTLIDIMCLDEIPSEKLGEYQERFLLYQEILNDVFTYNRRIGTYRDAFCKACDRQEEIGRKQLLEELKADFEKLAEEDCDECVVRFWGRRIRNYKKEWLADVRYIEFEDMKLPIAGKTEACLRLQYGYDWYRIPEAAEQETHAFVGNDISNNNYFDDVSKFIDWKEARAHMAGRKKANIEFLYRSIPVKKTNHRIMVSRLIGKSGILSDREELLRLYESGQYKEYIGRFEEILRNVKSFEDQDLKELDIDRDPFCKLMKALVFEGRYYDAEKAGRLIFGEDWRDMSDMPEEMEFLGKILEMAEAYQDRELDSLAEKLAKIDKTAAKRIPDCVRALYELYANKLSDISREEMLSLCDGILARLPDNYDIMKIKGDLLESMGNADAARALHETVYCNSRNGLDVLELDRKYAFADRYAMYNEEDR